MKPTTVYIIKGKHASQPYTVLIQPPKGEAYKLRQRYATLYTAKRGAARNVDGYRHRLYDRSTGKYKLLCYRTQNGVPIKFVLK